jgi:hypothetical protein
VRKERPTSKAREGEEGAISSQLRGGKSSQGLRYEMVRKERSSSRIKMIGKEQPRSKSENGEEGTTNFQDRR